MKILKRFALCFGFSLCSLINAQIVEAQLTSDEIPDLDVVFTKNEQIYRTNMRQAASGVMRLVLLANDFKGYFIHRRPRTKDQFAYCRTTGIVVMDTCGRRIIDYQRSGSGFHADFVWSYSGQYIVYGVYSGPFAPVPDPGIHRLEPNTGNAKRLVATVGFTYDHNPRYSLDDTKLSYIHHEYGSLNWFAVIDSSGGELQVPCNGRKEPECQLHGTEHDAHQYFTWIDQTHVLGLNRRDSSFVLIDITRADGVQYFHIDGSADQMSISPNIKKFVLRRPGYGPVKISYGEIGNWHQLKDINFGESVKNFAWIDDKSMVTYTEKGIFLILLDKGEVYRITDTIRTTTYGIEVLTP